MIPKGKDFYKRVLDRMQVCSFNVNIINKMKELLDNGSEEDLEEVWWLLSEFDRAEDDLNLAFNDYICAKKDVEQVVEDMAEFCGIDEPAKAEEA